jgi:uncharacterized protein CbrC (UPF0167 family)
MWPGSWFYIYVGPVYAREDLSEAVCPWCISDGSANAKYGATFTDEAGIGGYGKWERLSPDVTRLVVARTPGFSGWQQEQWFTHCGDAAAYLGPAGYAELLQLGSDVVKLFATELEEDGSIEDLDREGSPRAYVFRCRHCGQYGGYVDSD